MYIRSYRQYNTKYYASYISMGPAQQLPSERKQWIHGTGISFHIPGMNITTKKSTMVFNWLIYHSTKKSRNFRHTVFFFETNPRKGLAGLCRKFICFGNQVTSRNLFSLRKSSQDFEGLLMVGKHPWNEASEFTPWKKMADWKTMRLPFGEVNGPSFRGELSSVQNPGWLSDIGDYTTQL